MGDSVADETDAFLSAVFSAFSSRNQVRNPIREKNARIASVFSSC